MGASSVGRTLRMQAGVSVHCCTQVLSRVLQGGLLLVRKEGDHSLVSQTSEEQMARIGCSFACLSLAYLLDLFFVQ